MISRTRSATPNLRAGIMLVAIVLLTSLSAWPQQKRTAPRQERPPRSGPPPAGDQNCKRDKDGNCIPMGDAPPRHELAVSPPPIPKKDPSGNATAPPQNARLNPVRLTPDPKSPNRYVLAHEACPTIFDLQLKFIATELTRGDWYYRFDAPPNGALSPAKAFDFGTAYKMTFTQTNEEHLITKYPNLNRWRLDSSAPKASGNGKIVIRVLRTPTTPLNEASAVIEILLSCKAAGLPN